jgi:transcription initiation factor TFIIIB Brf1 subunit/transcription initiation factor TFIIB
MQQNQPNTPLNTNNKNLFLKSDATDIKYGDVEDCLVLFDDDEFDKISDEKIELECEDEGKLCPDCETRIQPMQSSYICPNCSRDIQIYEYKNEYSDSIVNNYNTSNNCAQSLRVVGKDANRYARALYKSTLNYDIIRSNTTRKQLNRYNAQSNHIKLPIFVLKEAAGLYKEFQKHTKVKRGKGRLGVLGACLSFICDKHKLSKQPKEIANFLEIEEAYLSKGDKLLRKAHADGFIDILVHYDPTDSYVERYFAVLDIDEKYKDFILEIIERSLNKDMKGLNRSRINTQCIGAIYALKIQLNLPFTIKEITESCRISKTTFMRYYDFLMKNTKKLNPICKKHGIPPFKKIKKKPNKKNILNMRSSAVSDTILNNTNKKK